MPRKISPVEGIDLTLARELLNCLWNEVIGAADAGQVLNYLDDVEQVAAIHASINHTQVGYRFCLPTQILGKLAFPSIDALALQRGSAVSTTGAWDARSFASKVVAPFNLSQESVLGTSADPYVGNAFRVPRMMRDDPSKKDLKGWNVLIDVIEAVQNRNDVAYSEAVLKQVLLEIHRRQATLRFSYPVPPRISLENALRLAREFLSQRSGGDRALAISGALFDIIGTHFGLYVSVNRARINASDLASGQAADLECIDASGRVVLAVEVRDRALSIADLEGTIGKARQRAITEILFVASRNAAADASAIQNRMDTAFASGQNLYRLDFFELAQSVFALGGEAIRVAFLRRVGEHLDQWNTQPSHRQAWKSLLESL